MQMNGMCRKFCPIYKIQNFCPCSGARSVIRFLHVLECFAAAMHIPGAVYTSSWLVDSNMTPGAHMKEEWPIAF